MRRVFLLLLGLAFLAGCYFGEDGISVTRSGSGSSGGTSRTTGNTTGVSGSGESETVRGVTTVNGFTVQGNMNSSRYRMRTLFHRPERNRLGIE